MRTCIVPLILLLLLSTCTKNRIEKGCLGTKEFSSDSFRNDSTVVFIPSGFTPNGDLLNDEFGPFMTNVEMLSFEIKRSSKSIKGNGPKKWDGIWDNGNEAKEGMYKYEYFLKSSAGVEFSVSGQMALMREFSSSNCITCRFEDQIDPLLGFVNPTNEQCN